MDRFLVNRVKPGTRVKLTGIYGICESRQQKKKKEALGPNSIAIKYNFRRFSMDHYCDIHLGMGRLSLLFSVLLLSECCLRIPYLRVVGIEADTEHAVSFSPEDEEEMHDLARSPHLYEKIAKSIAPNIWVTLQCNSCSVMGFLRLVTNRAMKTSRRPSQASCSEDRARSLLLLMIPSHPSTLMSKRRCCLMECV